MKKSKLVLPILLTASVQTIAWMPTFTEGVGGDTLKVNSVAIADHNDSITFPSPVFADWDSDGLEDMILGYWHSYLIKAGQGGGQGGKVRFYKNVGEKGSPVFEDKGNLQVSGSDISLEAA